MISLSFICWSLQFQGQHFALWPHFSDGSKKSCDFSVCCSFLLVRTEWWLLASYMLDLKLESLTQVFGVHFAYCELCGDFILPLLFRCWTTTAMVYHMFWPSFDMKRSSTKQIYFVLSSITSKLLYFCFTILYSCQINTLI